MAGRFDPVRDSVLSPPKRYKPLPEDMVRPEYHDAVHHHHDDYEARERRPSRSASIADILNSDEPEVGPSRIRKRPRQDVSSPIFGESSLSPATAASRDTVETGILDRTQFGYDTHPSREAQHFQSPVHLNGSRATHTDQQPAVDLEYRVSQDEAAQIGPIIGNVPRTTDQAVLDDLADSGTIRLTDSVTDQHGSPHATPLAKHHRSTLTYRPTSRVSAPTTIRMPVRPNQVEEMRFQCQNLLRKRWQQANIKRNDGFDSIVSSFAAQMSMTREASSNLSPETRESNASLVAHHYNSRQDQGLGARQYSPILPLRNFNNWVKSVIIGTYAKRHGRVLDLGGGKGGDLNKWEKADIAEYILCDIAAVSVEQAESRYRERRHKYSASFFSFDCFGSPLAENIPSAILEPRFDNVTLQFCLHYGWESSHKAQLMLENVARYLKPGGVFVGTIPNADLLRSRLAYVMDSSSDSVLTFGNEFYTVRFEPSINKKVRFPPFGHKYSFTLVDAVDDVAEYVVDWEQFVSLARQNGLHCIFKKTFEEIWQEEGQMDRFRDLTRRMKIHPHGPQGIPMNAELWEATGIYLAFAFEKR